MKIIFDKIELDTKDKADFYNITDDVKGIVGKSQVRNGFVILYTQHTTCAVKVHEWETEEGRDLIKDSLDFLEGVAPCGQDYRHDKTNVDARPNTHAHLKSLMLNSSETIPIRNGELLLGKWQGVYFIEMDGPRKGRTAITQVIGE